MSNVAPTQVNTPNIIPSAADKKSMKLSKIREEAGGKFFAAACKYLARKLHLQHQQPRKSTLDVHVVIIKLPQKARRNFSNGAADAMRHATERQVMRKCSAW